MVMVSKHSPLRSTAFELPYALVSFRLHAPLGVFAEYDIEHAGTVQYMTTFGSRH